MSMFFADYPVHGSGGGVPIYATLAAFPATATKGSLGVAADTGNIYEFNGTTWVLEASPSGMNPAPGSNGDILYNNAGLVGADPDFTTNGSGGITAASLALKGSTSGTFTQTAAATTTSYSIVWPNAQGDPASFPQNDGSGNISWTDSTGTGQVVLNESPILGGTVLAQNINPTSDASFNLGAAGSGWNELFVYQISAGPSEPGIYVAAALLQDSTGTTSINWKNRTLNDSSGAVQLTWSTSGISLTQPLPVTSGGTGASSLSNFTDTTAGADGITVTGGTGAVITATSIAQAAASATQNGYLKSTDWSTFNGKQPAGSYITALTGDVTASGPGSAAATLATVNSNVGSFTNASITVNAKGLVTAASSGTPGVTAVSVATANGLAGTSSGGTTPQLTLSTTITGVLQGNGTAISAASTTGTGNVVLATSPTITTPTLSGTTSANAINPATTATYNLGTATDVWNIVYANNVYASSGNPSIQVSNANLYDAAGDISIAWGSRQLIDSSDNLSIDWNMRLLADTTGTTQLNYSSTTGISLTHPLAVTSGGTGQSSNWNADGVIYASSTTALASTTVGTAGQVLTSNGSGNAPTFQTPATNSYYSGYASGASWTSTSGSFADMTVSGTNTMNTRYSNILSVSAAGSNLPGISFTPASASAVYQVTVSFPVYNNTANSDSAFQLTDGTTQITTAIVQQAGSVTGVWWTTMTALYAPGTSSSVTVKLQAATSGGSTTTVGYSNLGNRTMEWSILRIL
jgi:hypothetical protein